MNDYEKALAMLRDPSRWAQPALMADAADAIHREIESDKVRTIYRSAVTGKVVTQEYAEANPETTVKERR